MRSVRVCVCVCLCVRAHSVCVRAQCVCVCVCVCVSILTLNFEPRLNSAIVYQQKTLEKFISSVRIKGAKKALPYSGTGFQSSRGSSRRRKPSTTSRSETLMDYGLKYQLSLETPLFKYLTKITCCFHNPLR